MAQDSVPSSCPHIQSPASEKKGDRGGYAPTFKGMPWQLHISPLLAFRWPELDPMAIPIYKGV